MSAARVVVGVALALCACGTSDVYVGSDSPLTQPVSAAGAGEPPAALDASSPPVSIPPPSGGDTPALDAGAPAVDAGTPASPSDAAAAVPDLDAGAPAVDAGAPDTGVGTVDAGLPDTGSGAPTCAAGFDDCDGDPDNGCEHDVSADDANCGACGVVCPADAPSSSGSSCVGGACVLTCNLLQADCDGDPENGCEANLWISSDNCGECGVACLCHDGRCL